MKLLPTLTALSLLVPLWTAAQDEGLRRCRLIGDSVARLACYDALPAGGAAAPAAPARAAAPRAPAPSATAAPPATPSTPAAAPPAAPATAFGLERQQPREEVQAITSTIPGRFEGWGPRTRFKLANGQIWQVVDGSSAYYELDSPKVRIRRGLIGNTFYLDIEGQTRTPQVRRVE